MLRSETAAEPQRAAAALRGLAAYQRAGREPPPAPPRVAAAAGRARLLDFGGSGRPVLFVPSLINGSAVLDLLPDLSLMRWLAARGLRPLLLDWGTPTAEEAGLSIAGHIETMLLPLLRGIGRDAAVAGYCLGGTMALAAAARVPVAGLVTIAAPWRFAGFPDAAREGLHALWERSTPTVEALGLLPLEVLQAGFWSLDPARTVAKFVAFGDQVERPEAVRRFVALEDWANGGPPLTRAAGAELVLDLFGADLPGTGRWMVEDEPVDPAALACPVFDVVSTTDRIVPAASAHGAGETMRLAQGHVGMVMGGRARETLWEPLAAWLLRL